ncbi:sugar transferase, partial [Salmonella enterica subsp. enterica]|nr:sugar transferase [Salmonella enterica subsp. enterica]
PALDEDWQRFLTEQTLQGRPVYNNRQVYESLTGRLPIHHLYENELGSLLPSQTYLWFKQLVDILAILLVAPFVLLIALITVIAIRLESPGKAIFVQERVGQ